jgi:ribose transport system substrate-binding protein
MEAGVRSRVLLAAILIAAFSAGGCNRSRRRMIAVIPKATSHLFWLSVQAGAMAAGKEFKVEVLWNGPSQETEYDRQIQIVDSMVARHVDGIAVAAAERTALVQPIDRAVAAGIPVTVFDSGVDSKNYTSFLATNNYEAGQFAGRTLAGLIGGHGQVALLAHAPGSLSTMDRERGFEDVIKAEFPNVRIVARQFGMSDRAKSRAATENILTANPDLDGLFASSEPSSVGAALALKSLSRAGKTRFVAFDSSDTMIEDLRNGVIDAMVVQDPFKMGFEAVHTLIQKLDGQTPPSRIDLHARVIRKDDLDKPEVKALLRPDLQK